MGKSLMVAVGIVLVGLVVFFGVSRLLTGTGHEETKTPDMAVTITPAAASPTPASPLNATRTSPASAMDKGAAAPQGTALAAELDRAQGLIKQDKLADARSLLTPLILAAPEGPDREKIRAMLDAINERLFFSREPSPDSITYTVVKGDSLWVIRRKTGCPSVELIKLVNRRQSDLVRDGETLKIPQGTFSALVDREHFRLTVLLNGQYVKEYAIGIGKNDLTPAGVFEIASMDVNPAWTDPNGKVYEFGDPANILGSRWIGYKATATRSGLGIHGTSDDKSIGTKCSNGCVRMHNKDVDEVYGMLKKGDKVTMR